MIAVAISPTAVAAESTFRQEEVESDTPAPIPTSYTVQQGDTLSKIAAKEYGDKNTWPALWWVNRHTLANPDSLKVGQVLILSSWHPVLSWLLSDALKVIAPAPVATAALVTTAPVSNSIQASASYAGHYTFQGLEALWVGAGGPSSVEAEAATIAECESGGDITAANPSGASGLWQILGAPQGWTGSTNWFNPYTNALAAVTKFRQAGGTFAPWVCQA